jgi:hypothetical protein
VWRRLIVHWRRGGLNVDAPRSRAFTRLVYRTIAIERSLPRRNFGDGLIDRGVSPLFRRGTRRCALKKFPLAALTFGALGFIAKAAALLLRSAIAAALRPYWVFVAEPSHFTLGAAPLAVVGIPPPVGRRRIQPTIIVEATVAMRQRSLTESVLSLVVARAPLRLLTKFPFRPRFNAITPAFVRPVLGRNGSRLRLIGFAVPKPMHSIATIHGRLSTAGRNAPLRLVWPTVLAPLRSIAILEHVAIVVLRTFATRLVYALLARAPGRVRWAPRFMVVNFSASRSRRAVAVPFFCVG